jgi:hypothetical protein
MNDRDLRRLVSAMNGAGAEDVAVENGKHHKLFFSIKGCKAHPIVISKTPSDRFARAKVAADIRREFKRLGILPPSVSALGGVIGGIIGGIVTIGAVRRIRESIWDLLDEWERDGREDW